MIVHATSPRGGNSNLLVRVDVEIWYGKGESPVHTPGFHTWESFEIPIEDLKDPTLELAKKFGRLFATRKAPSASYLIGHEIIVAWDGHAVGPAVLIPPEHIRQLHYTRLQKLIDAIMATA